jgi:hypothetical protein
MRSSTGIILALFTCAVLCIAAPSRAAVDVTLGASWDGSNKSLQKIVDGLFGAGRISVKDDYLGRKSGDPDPWFWFDNRFSTFLVKEVAGNANRNQLGWYEETGTQPVITNDNIHDGIVFDGPDGAGTTAVVSFIKPLTRFGFYMNPNGSLDAANAPEPEKFYTNRRYNDLGPDGRGALHAPFDGDVQALIYDLSLIEGPNTWLVCFEDLDAGANPGPAGSAQTDNDYNDFIFEVTAFGATPVQPLTFGALKAKYTH